MPNRQTQKGAAELYPIAVSPRKRSCYGLDRPSLSVTDKKSGPQSVKNTVIKYYGVRNNYIKFFLKKLAKGIYWVGVSDIIRQTRAKNTRREEPTIFLKKEL